MRDIALFYVRVSRSYLLSPGGLEYENFLIDKLTINLHIKNDKLFIRIYVQSNQ